MDGLILHYGFQTRGAHSTCYATDRIELIKTLFDNIDPELSSNNLKSQGPAEDQNVGDEEIAETAPSKADGFLFIDPDDDEQGDDEMRRRLLRLSIDALLTSAVFEFNFSIVSDELVNHLVITFMPISTIDNVKGASHGCLD